MLTSISGKTTGLIASLLLLLASFVASLALGHYDVSLATLRASFMDFDPASTGQLIVVTERLPRAIVAALVGAGLAVAGALMQSVTRNALASPGILGINAGAMLFVVVGSAFLPLQAPWSLTALAFAGATVAASLVYLLGREPAKGAGIAPLRLVLAGVAVTALFIAVAQGLLVINQERFGDVMFWLAGSVSSRSLDSIGPVLPLFLLAFVATALLTRQLNILGLDEAMVSALGQSTGFVRLATGGIVVVLAGASVALAGMIGFVGLIVPHLVRGLFGRDHRWLLPACLCLGGSLLLIADTAARFIIPPREIPVGVMTALIGAPLFLYLASRRSPSL